MQKRTNYILFVCFGMLLFISSSFLWINVKESKEIKPTEMVRLRVIMREMLNQSDSIRERLIKGEEVGKWIYDASEIITAKSTNERTKEPFYKGLADTYFQALKTFNASRNKKTFNGLVDACVNCHETVCKGPISRIKKLYIHEGRSN